MMYNWPPNTRAQQTLLEWCNSTLPFTYRLSRSSLFLLYGYGCCLTALPVCPWFLNIADYIYIYIYNLFHHIFSWHRCTGPWIAFVKIFCIHNKTPVFHTKTSMASLLVYITAAKWAGTSELGWWLFITQYTTVFFPSAFKPFSKGAKRKRGEKKNACQFLDLL